MIGPVVKCKVIGIMSPAVGQQTLGYHRLDYFLGLQTFGKCLQMLNTVLLFIIYFIILLLILLQEYLFYLTTFSYLSYLYFYKTCITDNVVLFLPVPVPVDQGSW